MSETPKDQTTQPQTESPPTPSSETDVDQTAHDDPEVNLDNIDNLLSDLADSIDESENNDPTPTSDLPPDDSSSPSANDSDDVQVDQALLKLEEELNDLVTEVSDATDHEDSKPPKEQPLQENVTTEDPVQESVVTEEPVQETETTEQPVDENIPQEQDIDKLLAQISEELDDPDESPAQADSSEPDDSLSNILEEDQPDTPSITQEEVDVPVSQDALDQAPETPAADTKLPSEDIEIPTPSQDELLETKVALADFDKDAAPTDSTQTDPQDALLEVPQDEKSKKGDTFSLPARLLLKTLSVINKPFGSISESTRQIIGFVAVVTLMVTMITVALLLLV